LKYWNFINVVFAGKILELCIRWQNNRTLYSCANCYSCISLPPFVLALQAIFNHDARGSRELYCAISLAKWQNLRHNLVASPKIYTPLALGGCQFRALVGTDMEGHVVRAFHQIPQHGFHAVF